MVLFVYLHLKTSVLCLQDTRNGRTTGRT